VRYAIAIVLVLAGACKTGGEYGKSTRMNGGAELDRGDVNGRMFDFVSNKPEGDDWQIRIRGSSLWASYGKRAQVDDLGTVTLTDAESTKVWSLIDALELDQREKGKPDEDEGWVQLRLREPAGDEGHEVTEVFVQRTTEDEAVIGVGEYLRKLVGKYHRGKKPDF
jgi:hypothetical protein